MNLKFILMGLLNNYVVSVLITMAFYTEFTITNQSKSQYFYFVLFSGVFVLSLILGLLLKNQKVVAGSGQPKKKWSPLLLGQKRAFAPYEPEKGKEYRYDVDAILLIFSVIIFIGVHALLPLLADKGFLVIKTFDLKNYFYALIIFFTYSLFMVSDYLYSNEIYIAQKRGKITVGLGVKLSYFLVILLSVGVLTYVSYLSLRVIF